MKKIITILIALTVLLSAAVSVQALDGNAVYSGNSGEFIFEPGSEYSPTDLFPNFKGVMPGDSLTQKITVKNDADKNVKVKIYVRSLGAHENSEEFLSKLGLRVKKSDDNKMEYMFDAMANETAQLTDWVCLGTLYSGGEVNLDVILDVPVELDNEFANEIGYLDWEFMIEEFPVEESDPDAPQTGDDFDAALWITILACALTVFVVIFIIRRKKNDEEGTEKNQ